MKAVLFDLDGTLLNTIGDITETMNQVLGRYGFPTFTEDEYEKKVGWGIHTLVRLSLPAKSREEYGDRCLADLKEIYGQVPYKHTRPYPGIPELLRDLRRDGIAMSILSNKVDSLTQVVVAELLGDHSFVFISGARDDVPVKPDPILAKEAVEAMKTTPQEVFMLGDSDIDVETAKNAGLIPVGAAWGFRPAEDLRQAGAVYVAEKPADFYNFIKGYGK